MSYLRRATPVLLATVTLAAGCGGSSDSTGNPTAPSSPPAAGTSPSTPQVSGLPVIAGSWNGTSDFETSNNVHLVTTISATVMQKDRNVEGTIQFTGSGWTRWRGTFKGVLYRTVEPVFTGSVNLQAEPFTGTGVCTGQMSMSGLTTARSMRWEAPSLAMTPSAPSQAQACIGTVRNIAWIFNR